MPRSSSASRICDVSLGTLRTISVVNGRLRLSVALGRAVLRVISEKGTAVAEALREFGDVLGVFESEMNDNGSRLVFATMARRKVPIAVGKARELDPHLLYVVERFSETSHPTPLPSPTGWRAILKRK